MTSPLILRLGDNGCPLGTESTSISPISKDAKVICVEYTTDPLVTVKATATVEAELQTTRDLFRQKWPRFHEDLAEDLRRTLCNAVQPHRQFEAEFDEFRKLVFHELNKHFPNATLVIRALNALQEKVRVQ